MYEGFNIGGLRLAGVVLLHLNSVGGYEVVIRLARGMPGRSLASHWLEIALTIQMD